MYSWMLNFNTDLKIAYAYKLSKTSAGWRKMVMYLASGPNNWLKIRISYFDTFAIFIEHIFSIDKGNSDNKNLLIERNRLLCQIWGDFKYVKLEKEYFKKFAMNQKKFLSKPLMN